MKVTALFILCLLSLVACAPPEDGHVVLGNDFVLLRTSSVNVRVKDWGGGSGIEISDVCSLGFDSNTIVAVSMSPGSVGSNYWIVNKKRRIMHGPLREMEFLHEVKTNSMLGGIELRGVWTYRGQ